MKQLFPLALALLATSCSLLSTSCSETRYTTQSHMDIEGANGMEIGYGGATLVFDETIAFHSETTTDTEEGSFHEATINGLTLSLIDGTLRIGDTYVEGVEDGDKVELGKAGIFVNGELRAAMPAAAENAADDARAQ